jgi:hypothetical protein
MSREQFCGGNVRIRGFGMGFQCLEKNGGTDMKTMMISAFLATVLVSVQAQQADQRTNSAPRRVQEGDPSFVAQLKTLDVDGNGQLSAEEASKAQMFRPSLFTAIDTDGNGQITVDEAKAADRIDSGNGAPRRIEFEGKSWVADHAIGAEVVQFKGKQALHIVGREASFVYLPIDDFENGTIEADVAGDIFSGIAFRGREHGKRAEKVYFRPQNANTEKHQNTVQYGVIGREDGHWRYLRTNFPGKYEAGADIRQSEWFHVRLEIKGSRLEVFVDNASDPVLTVDPMLDGISRGSVGVWGWDSYFANLKIAHANQP